MLTFLQAIITIATAVAAGAALLSARASRAAADASRQATEATLVASFMKNYSSSLMNEALIEIRQYIDDPENKETLEAIAASPYEDMANDPSANRSLDPVVNSSLREIYYHFKTAYSLHMKGFISLESLRLISDVPGYQLLHRYVRPMSLRTNPELEKESPDIGEIRRQFAWFDDYRKKIDDYEKKIKDGG